ncbi:MAG TPA: pyridoxal-phosphate dependent enzyme [Gemmataceae bacterium]|nr:pyridoxal-phosphate dependent enzyme [Gemmataceae bacterium]
MTRYACDLADIEQAAVRVGRWAHRTPVATCATLDRFAGRALFFKCENLQKVGAFKFRGAVNAIAQLAPDVAKRGVVTHSSGNHAQAVALAARLHGIAAHIVMPSTAAAVKRRAVEDYGGRVILCEPNLAARESTSAKVLAETGATMIPPYNHPHVIAGQGTAALELLEQVPDLDAIVAPVGGGGLISGVTLAARGRRPDIRVFAAEPAGADDAFRSKAAGQLIPQTGPKTVADGLLTSLGELTWPIIRDLVEDVLTVRENEIIAAMRMTWERAKILIEPSSAVAVAAVLTDAFRARPGLKRVGIILSGGNVDLDRLPWQTS